MNVSITEQTRCLALFTERVLHRLSYIDKKLESGEDAQRVPFIHQRAFFQGLLTAIAQQNLTIFEAQDIVRAEIRKQDYRNNRDCHYLNFMIDNLLPVRTACRRQ